MSTFSNSLPGRPDGPPSVPPDASAHERASWPARIKSAAPNLLVFALMAVVIYVGHHTGWRLPNSSQLFGSTSAAAPDWCAEHLVPGSACVECKPALLPRPKEHGFCATHGVAECVICHPELAHVKGQPRMPRYDTAEALNLIERPGNNSRNVLHKRRVQFANAAAADKAGVDIDVVQERPMREFVSANGELLFDPTRVAHLSSRAGGTVAMVFKQVGDAVAAEEILALVDAVQVSQAKSQLQQAIVQRDARQLNYARLKAAGEGVAAITVADAHASLQQAEVALISARQELVNLGLDVPEEIDQRDPKQVARDLRFLGIPADLVESLPAAARSANLIAIRAPHAGVIVSAEVVAGEVVNPDDVLFTVVDPSRMWLTLHVRQEDARYVTKGQKVEFQTDGGTQEVTGPITWISPTVDPRTRTVQARIVVENSQGRLKDNTFGTGQILLREQAQAMVVPREAVQSTADTRFVFVRDRNYLDEKSPKVFHPRQVRVGARDDKYIEILAGVLPGEVVATTGSGVLLAQLLRGDLGAACGCHEQ